MRPATVRTRIAYTLFIALLGVFTIATGAEAQRENKDATIGLYLLEGTVRCNQIEPLACNDESIVVEGNLFTPYYAVLCVFNGDAEKGVQGLSCGIDYDGVGGSGVEMWGWTVCADGLEFPYRDIWPDAGGGNRITWASCQQEEPGGGGTGVTAVVGFFYVTAYSPDRLSVITNNVDSGPELQVGACDNATSDLLITQAGWVGFSSDGEEKGELPCLDREVSDTTWGDVKNKYGGR
jgi:hypothetical protein